MPGKESNIIKQVPDWQKSAPYVRRFVLITGWLIFLFIPCYIIFHDIQVGAAYATMYGTLSSIVGVAVGFYFHRRSSQDDEIIKAVEDEMLKPRGRG